MSDKQRTGFTNFAAKRMVLIIILMIAGLWAIAVALKLFDKSAIVQKDHFQSSIDQKESRPPLIAKKDILPDQAEPVIKEHGPFSTEPAHIAKNPEQATPHFAPGNENIQQDDHRAQAKKSPEIHKTQTNSTLHASQNIKAVAPQLPGIAFVQAAVKPLSYELNERFYGWRPNDIFNFTDNVNNFQLGVLEVTRRTAIILTERISRTGSTASIDDNLEKAMNWFMIKADRYWFPSPESKFQAGLDELNKYIIKLREGRATFYTRPDNLIPLLRSYENLLGSCDENLVKAYEGDGDAVSFFAADDYFYYAQGIASAMGTILTAIHHDFFDILESRHGIEILHHAILSCERATEIKPWVVTEGDLSGILANHRANMAAPISHAKFYIGLLVRTLST